MMIFLEVLKWIFLVVAIAYTFSNVVKACRRQTIRNYQIWIMANAIVGFLVFQFRLGV